MKYCSKMLGNTSSGFVEASFFPKYVINIGERQKGRILTENIYNCKIEREEIITAVKNFEYMQLDNKIDLYGDGTAASKIVSELKAIQSY
jgi:GDP/UDP-N,N'-diacetylbacillosamine 2-epimerase (hydrolysing)